MDASRFDQLTKSLAGSSRRSLLRMGLGLAGGVLAGARIGHAGAASALRKEGEICRKNGDCASDFCGPADATGRQRCALCLEGTSCGDGKVCVDGVCRGNGVCGPGSTDTIGCGGNACHGGSNGCVPTAEGGLVCMSGTDCETAQACTSSAECPPGMVCNASSSITICSVCRPLCGSTTVTATARAASVGSIDS